MNKKVVIGLLLILLLGWIAGSSYWYLCKINKYCDTCTTTEASNKEPESSEAELINQAPIEEVTYPTFSINDGNSFNSSNKENINFGIGNANLVVSDSLATNFNEINDYLANNPDKKLSVTGLYTTNENGTEELGYSRATALVEYLNSNYGIDSERTEISSQLTESLYMKSEDSTTHGALELAFTGGGGGATEETVSTPTNVDEKIMRHVKRTKTLYYPPNEFDIDITDDLKRYFKKLKVYFDQNPEGLVEITGHTDSDGRSSSNMRLSLKRAELVKSYLIKKYDFNPRNFRVEGKGDRRPVDRSGTEIAKAKNRRVTFTYIK